MIVQWVLNETKNDKIIKKTNEPLFHKKVYAQDVNITKKRKM